MAEVSVTQRLFTKVAAATAAAVFLCAELAEQ
jgi:hypothetical protein